MWIAVIAALAVVGGAVAVQAMRDDSGSGEESTSASRHPALYTFETDDIHALAFDPQSEGRLVFGHHGGVMASEDAGRSWTDLADRSNFDGMNLAFDPQQAGRLLLAGHNVFAASDDAGATWTSLRTDLPGLDLHAFAASPEQGRFYAFAGGQGLFVSTGGTESWEPLWPEAPPGTHSIVDPGNGTLVLGAGDAGILRSEDGGQTWVDSRQGIDSGVIFSIKADPSATRLYAATSGGLYVSADGGRSWSLTALDDTMIVSVAVNPDNPDEVMAVDRDGSLFHSLDAGVTWLQ